MSASSPSSPLPTASDSSSSSASSCASQCSASSDCSSAAVATLPATPFAASNVHRHSSNVVPSYDMARQGRNQLAQLRLQLAQELAQARLTQSLPEPQIEAAELIVRNDDTLVYTNSMRALSAEFMNKSAARRAAMMAAAHSRIALARLKRKHAIEEELMAVNHYARFMRLLQAQQSQLFSLQSALATAERANSERKPTAATAKPAEPQDE